MMIRLLVVCWSVLGGLSAPAWGAVTISWDCNPEADMRDYRVERSSNAGQYWGVLAEVPHPVPCQSPVATRDTTYLNPGEKLYRLFARDQSGNISTASRSAAITIPVSPIGNPGGQVEQPLPPSPLVVVAPPPPTPVIGPVLLHAADVTATTAKIRYVTPIDSGGGAVEVDVRLALSPIAWGRASSLACVADVCSVAALAPDTDYQAQAVGAVRVTGQPTRWSAITDPVTFRTAKVPVVPPPPPAEQCQDGRDNDGDGNIDFPADPGCTDRFDNDEADVATPPPTDEVRAKLAEIEARLTSLETMGHVLDAEMRATRDTLRAMCRALGGCP